MIRVEFRPIDQWPAELRRPGARRDSPFKAGYADTLELIDRGLGHLDAKDIVIEIAVDPSEIRIDGSGWPTILASWTERSKAR
jgi:hypothetical protein